MWGIVRLQVHGHCNHRFAHMKVVEDSLSYKRHCLRYFRNPACGDSTGSNGTEKDRFRMPSGLFFFVVQNHPCFSVNDLQLATLTHLNNKPVFTIYFAGWYSFLYFTNIPSICIFILFCVFIFNAHLVFL